MVDLDKDDHIKKGFELEFIACDLAHTSYEEDLTLIKCTLNETYIF